jgi:peroxin-5
LNEDAQLEQFESAFQRHSEWAQEFDTWDRQFAQFEQDDEDDIIAKRVEQAALEVDFDSIWGHIQDELEQSDTYFPKREYVFEANNPFLTHMDPMAAGTSLLNQSLSDAALAFEAAAQKSPQYAEAWVQLGLTQAQNEKEEAAIRALERAVQVDPQRTDAIMALAISYTNESSDPYPTLENWISLRYPQVIGPSDLNTHERVTGLFLRAAREAPKAMDPDVQVGLGVLFYKNGEYDKAVDCFASALNIRPNVSQTNSSLSETC